MRLAIVGGSLSQVLALKVAKMLRAPFIDCEYKKFPDGEKYVRIDGEVEGYEVAVIHSMHHTPDECLVEYFLLVDTLKDLGAKKVTGVIPYFPYARQDERFNQGEALSLKTVASLIEKAGTDKVITIDMHLHRIESINKIFKIPAENITAIPLIAQYIKENFKIDKPLIIGPDEEAEQWAKTMAAILDADYDILEKKRISSTEVEVTPRQLQPQNRNVIIIDDIISTGGTLAKTIQLLKSKGAKTIIAACTHPILVDNALKKIYKAGAETVIATDTVPSPVSQVTVAPLIAQTLSSKS
ncbi:MAG: ribose-phosphate diphosphokinase [Candidatus Jordarchaeales archaeon]|nr:ribose-phosphate diphosphokinase [Candidatus Jordarchaeia archaeon]